MNTALQALESMCTALSDCAQGRLHQNVMIQVWRREAGVLVLPERFDQVLNDLLDRMETTALFSDESCSFSRKDLLNSLSFWADKAKTQIMQSDASQMQSIDSKA